MARIVFDSRKKLITHATEEETLMTVYDLEYTKKIAPRTRPYCPPELMPELSRETPDPISEAFRQELLPDYERDQKPDREEYEAGTPYFHKLKDRKPSIVKVVDKEVEQDVLAEDHRFHHVKRTVYQVDYCEVDDYYCPWTAGMRPKAIPNDWKPVPLSLYRLNYKDHNKTATWKIVPDQAHQPPSYFDPNPQERKLLNVGTGITEYQAVIDRLGEEVIRKEYHGHIYPLPGEFVPENGGETPPPPPPTPNGS